MCTHVVWRVYSVMWCVYESVHNAHMVRVCVCDVCVHVCSEGMCGECMYVSVCAHMVHKCIHGVVYCDVMCAV